MAGKQTIQAFKKLIDPIKRSAMSMISRIVLRSVIDTGGLQTIKASILADFTKDGMERMQNYGMTSNPPVGSEGLAVFVGGNSDHPVVICIDNREFRFKNLAPGEVVFYSDEGDSIEFRRGHIVNIITHTLNLTASVAINMTAPLITATAATGINFDTPTFASTGIVSSGGNMACGGALAATGNITLLAAALSLENFRDIYNTHTHPENGDGGGTTSGPIETL